MSERAHTLGVVHADTGTETPPALDADAQRLRAFADCRQFPGVRVLLWLPIWFGDKADTCLEIVRVLHASTGDSKYRPAPLLVKYVEAGWYGKKSGRGFYDYSGAEPVPTR